MNAKKVSDAFWLVAILAAIGHGIRPPGEVRLEIWFIIFMAALALLVVITWIAGWNDGKARADQLLTWFGMREPIPRRSLFDIESLFFGLPTILAAGMLLLFVMEGLVFSLPSWAAFGRLVELWYAGLLIRALARSVEEWNYRPPRQ